jgi:hypothetical protein
MDATTLKATLAALPPEVPENFRVRCHRAISWLKRAEQEVDDPDARFIFLWISFNAAYAWEFGHEQNERDLLRKFLQRMIALDEEKQLQATLFRNFTGCVRTLIDNPYLFDPFWRACRDHDSSGRWEESFQIAKKVATTAVMSGQTDVVLSVVFDRLYVLRNQLVHGGATHASRVNRQQVNDSVALLGQLVPLIIALMLRSDGNDFGGIAYPVIGNA